MEMLRPERTRKVDFLRRNKKFHREVARIGMHFHASGSVPDAVRKLQLPTIKLICDEVANVVRLRRKWRRMCAPSASMGTR